MHPSAIGDLPGPEFAVRSMESSYAWHCGVHQFGPAAIYDPYELRSTRGSFLRTICHYLPQRISTLLLLFILFGHVAVADTVNRPDPYIYFVDEIWLSLTIDDSVRAKLALDKDTLIHALAETTAAIARDGKSGRTTHIEDASAFEACDPAKPEYRTIHAHFDVRLDPNNTDSLLIKTISRKGCDMRRTGRYAPEISVTTTCPNIDCVQARIVESTRDFLAILAASPVTRPYE